MKDNLMIFKDERFGSIRSFEADGKIWFIGKDLAILLGYKDTKKALKQHCKHIEHKEFDTNGGTQKLTVIPEGDMYRLIAGSQLPAAEEFEAWLFDDVIPSIRKHGVYATQEFLESPEEIQMKVLQELKAERKAIHEEGMNMKEIENDLAFYKVENRHYAKTYTRVVDKLQKEVGELRNKLRYHRLED